MIGIIDYGMGNLRSVSKAFEFLGAETIVSDTPEMLSTADAVVLPGVGHFGDGMKHLKERNMDKFILHIANSGKPFMGICLGLQLLMEESEEAPGVPGLGVFKGKVLRFPEMGLKVPHMGWNDVSVTESGTARFADIQDNSYFYFVHSFYVAPEDESIIAGKCTYGIDFTAAVSKENVFATQFHPEKSQDWGLQLLKNFVDSLF